MLSIVMPYYMRQAALDRSLISLRKWYGDVDIVICDDGSPVPVKAPGCTVVTLPMKADARNPCVPINRAVEAAKGDVLVLTNPEIEHTQPVLEAMQAVLTEQAYVLAACRDADGSWLCHSSIRGNEEGRGPMPAGSGFHFCAMLHRSLFNKTGGFDESYRDGQAFEDNDWLMRLQAAGAQFILRDDLVVKHYRTQCPWPSGGHARNHMLFKSKWAN